MNYTQAYKTLVAYGCPPDEARDILEKAEITPVTTLIGGQWTTVSLSARLGFRIVQGEHT